MKLLPLILLLNFISVDSSAQSIKNISESICDSINSIEFENEQAMWSAQLRIYHHEMIKYPTLLVDITEINRPRQYNEFNYKINRELLKTCPKFKDQFSLMPLSYILDVEALINEQQQDSLELTVVDFIYSKKINLIIVSIDDLFPYENLEDFAASQGKKWKIGARYDRGGIMIVVSKKLNEISISLSDATQAFLTDSDCKDISKKEAIPFFDQDNYFKGLINCIIALKKKV